MHYNSPIAQDDADTAAAGGRRKKPTSVISIYTGPVKCAPRDVIIEGSNGPALEGLGKVKLGGSHNHILVFLE